MTDLLVTIQDRLEIVDFYWKAKIESLCEGPYTQEQVSALYEAWQDERDKTNRGEKN